ncbi:hypothetical protein SAMN05192558_11322 [Actinokineospora alba]|uniref:Excreted virulence factor EspC, type VII ESX diderm n=1 Tax=Actinokineospora alba TaxID=504798 RepID=A0A1H0V5J5_9PSEU|nr:hypothetical protein [Actinokineospora alba]TDP65474.1 hypothetical protein C8E96_0956 [Actinokineospora alba]SDH63191.1 hypothetical protein SAMN05421871_101776 [Actinokineospora alba]SDP73611.1 hypothetical protein SAMN05192558_11322 [Actinokineospora alba]
MGKGKGGGFDFDPEAVRGFAAVFADAQAQVTQIQAKIGQTEAKSADFGKSFVEHGAKFEQYMAALAADLAHLATHLGEVHAKLNEGTELVVTSDSSGYTSMKTLDERLQGSKPSTGSSSRTQAV